MPDEIVEETCSKNDKNCYQIIVPSRHSTNDKSADIRVVRPILDGGMVEVLVAIVPK
jgi:hypothetical protein